MRPHKDFNPSVFKVASPTVCLSLMGTSYRHVLPPVLWAMYTRTFRGITSVMG
jgi:hypothetical protein